MYHLKRRVVLIPIIMIAVVLVMLFAIWIYPKQISMGVISDEIYVGRIHLFVSYDNPENPYIGTPDLDVHGVTFDESSGEYQKILNMIEAISYLNCFHTVFKPTDTNGKYSNLIRISWTSSNATPFDVYFFEGSNHVRINDKYYYLFNAQNLYNEWATIVK